MGCSWESSSSSWCTASVHWSFKEWSNDWGGNSSTNRVDIDVSGVITSWVWFSGVNCLWWVDVGFGVSFTMENVFCDKEFLIISIITSIADIKDWFTGSATELFSYDVMPSFIEFDEFLSSSSSVNTPVINDNVSVNCKSWSVSRCCWEHIFSSSVNSKLTCEGGLEAWCWEISWMSSTNPWCFRSPVEFWFNLWVVSSFSTDIISCRSARLSWEVEIFSGPSWNQTKIYCGLWLWFTLAVFNMPVLWDSTEVSSISNVVSFVINVEWESFKGHHLVVRSIIKSWLTLRSISCSKDNSSVWSFFGINFKCWIRSVINRPVFIIEKPLLILIVSLEMLNSESSSSIDTNIS